MELLHRFQQYVQTTLAVAPGDSLVLAVSGGRDSMLMAHLFVAAGYQVLIAHCNFMLRAEESDKDEQLVRDYAQQHALPFFVQRFDTTAYAHEHGVSIQMAARTLRYTWFEKLRQAHAAQWIAVAQHQNDHIETALLNLTRGTGLQGLQGILPKRGNIIRPILFLSAQDVLTAVQQAQIPFRDDQSNFSTKYARNKIRLEVIPKFNEINPDFEQNMLNSIGHFQEAYTLLQSFVAPIRAELFQQQGALVCVERQKLQVYLDNPGLMFELFRPYTFTREVLQDMQRAWTAESGRRFQSPTHELLLDREKAWIKPLGIETVGVETRQIAAADTELHFGSFNFKVHVDDDLHIRADPYRAQLDYDKLLFPLVIRFWHEGDFFYPLGMQGRKKLSDFFIQQKIDIYAKRNIPILVNGNGEILWLVGFRLDNRYRITESTKKVFTLDCK